MAADQPALAAIPFTPEEEAAERAYIFEYVSDPRLRRWLATLDSARAPRPEDASPLRPGVCECGPVCASCGRLRVAGDAGLPRHPSRGRPATLVEALDSARATLHAALAPTGDTCRHCPQQGHTTEWHEAHYGLPR